MSVKSSWLPLLVLFLGAALLTWFYMGQETFFYWSDFNYYQFMMRSALSIFQENALYLLMLVWISMGMEYNMLFAVPLLPFVSIMGDTRLVYVESLVLLYMVPLVLVLASLALRVAGQTAKSSYWVAVAIIMLLPATWAPSLRGYPDAAALLMLALSALVATGTANRKPTRAYFAIGPLLALSFLLRRHFAFGCLALGFALVVAEIFSLFHANKHEQSNDIAFGDRIARLSIVGVSGALVVVTLGFLTIKLILENSYGDLYKAFQLSFAETAWYFLSLFGIPIWCMAILGWVFAIRSRKFADYSLCLGLVWSFVSMVLWLSIPRVVGMHYSLHFLPFVAIGLFCFWCFCVQALEGRFAIGARLIFFGYLLLNAFVGLLPVDLVKSTSLKPFCPGMLVVPKDKGETSGRLFSASFAPLVRHDLDNMKKLVDLLRKQRFSAFEREHIYVYVPAASDILGPDVIRNAERELFPGGRELLRTHDIPCVDTRDSFPLEQLMQSDVVLVSRPGLYYIKEEHQKLLTMVSACFEQNWPIASDFEKLPQIHLLDSGVEVDLWRRVRRTDAARAALTLGLMRRYLVVRPAGQPDWITTGKLSAMRGESNKSSFWFYPESSDKNNSFDSQADFLLYAWQLPQKFTVRGSVKLLMNETQEKEISGDNALEIRCSLLDGNACEKPLSAPVHLSNEQKDFAFQFANETEFEPKYLILRLNSASLKTENKDLALVIEQLSLVPE